MRIAIIGTREPSASDFERLKNWSKIIIEKGFEVSTGAADGCDNAAMRGAELAREANAIARLHVFLPWSTYNNQQVPKGASVTVYNERLHKEWAQSVRDHHPNPDKLSRGGFALHARNYGILAYPSPADAVIALPKSLKNQGGTGQGIRLAESLGIKVYNLLLPGAGVEAEEMVRAL